MTAHDPPSTIHLTNAYHPASGGIRTFYAALLEEANRAGRRVALIVPGSATRVEAVGRFGRIYHVAARRAPAFDRRYRVIWPYQYFPGRLGGDVIGILERERPDLVEICDKYSLPYLAAMLRRRWHPRVPRPVLVGASCERFDDNMAAYLSPSRAARAFTRWYIRHIYGPPFDVHIANSEYTAAELRAALWDRPPGFIRVCPAGVDVDAFSPQLRSGDLRVSMLARAGGAPSSTLLVYAGRLSPEKNIGLLVETLRRLVQDADADYRLVLAGDGPAAAGVHEQAGTLRGRIALVGNLDRPTLAALYASCDAFIHPNPREPFGIGPLEAMASGVPVVVPAAGGVLEYATNANAWLADPAPSAFAAAVRSALRGDRHRLAAARQTAVAYGLRTATERYFTLYDRLVAEAGRQKGAAAAAHGSTLRLPS